MKLVFDIGKTNKKAFIFDKNFKEVWKEYCQFEELEDEEGFPCDDLSAIEKWIHDVSNSVLRKGDFEIDAINFSTYGASLVHLDRNGKVLSPLINYLKPYPEDILSSFYQKYGNQSKIARETASPQMGMLNSGFQLYWLKYAHPEIFKKIKWSLHFPQYLSCLLTGIPLSDYTSLGCHTNLWDYSNMDYHSWVYEEGMEQILAPLVSTDTSINKNFSGRQIKVGVGVHDSSAALLPYLGADKKPFLLISTGTWSISLNPFNDELLTEDALEKDCLNFLRINGKAVRAARLFLGEEYKFQLGEMEKYFGKDPASHHQLKFEESSYQKLSTKRKYAFSYKHLKTPWEQASKSQLHIFQNFEQAYHQLMWELVQLQVISSNLAIGNTPIKKIYIDGGFANNRVYVEMLARHYPRLKIRRTQSPLGSALGAAMLISEEKIGKKFLKKNYALKKYKPTRKGLKNG